MRWSIGSQSRSAEAMWNSSPIEGDGSFNADQMMNINNLVNAAYWNQTKLSMNVKHNSNNMVI